MRSGQTSGDPVDSAALQCQRFWLPRGVPANLGDDGFLVDPESDYAWNVGPAALPLEGLAEIPVLGLIGEPGMGKSTALDQEARRIASATEGSGDRLLWVDLAACGTDTLVCQEVSSAMNFDRGRTVTLGSSSSSTALIPALTM